MGNIIAAKELTLLRTLFQVHKRFGQDGDINKAFNSMLDVILETTNSEHGFIGEVLSDINGDPYLKTRATTHIAWNQEIKNFEEKDLPKGLEFNNIEILLGRVITSGKYLISNRPHTESRRGGFLKGHTQMGSFMGIPILFGQEIIGIVGIANRPEGYDESLMKFLDPLLLTYTCIIQGLREKCEREKTIKKLEEKNTEFETFIYRAAHDLRGPVSTIKGLVNIGNIETKKTFVSQCLEMVGECANKLDNILIDLRDIVKIKQTQIEISEVDLEALIKMQISIFQGSRNFDKIKWNISSRVKQPFYSDLTLINIIIQNILDNSIKYVNQVKRDPIIKADISVMNDCCVFSISDNGPGIEEKYLDKVSQMFFKANERSDGPGVGLYLVKNAVDKLGGEIEITSEFNIGCSLKITLPTKITKCGAKAELDENQSKLN